MTEERNLATSVKYASSVTHWPAGPLKGLTYSNGTTFSQTFNLRYEPLTITSGPVSLALTPAKAGGFSAIQVGTAVTSYGRDFLDHLVSATPSTGAPAFTYRYTGDRITEAWSVEATPRRRFAYDDQTNLSAISVYDSIGTTITSTTCLVHDGLNRLVAVGPAKVLAMPDATACRLESDLSTVQVRFQYDAQHRRIARQDGTGPWKQYVFGPDGNPLSELWRPTSPRISWSPIRDYVWLDGKPLAQLEYPGPQVYAVHSDHLGLPRALTSSTGATIWSAETRPYGDLVETTSTGAVTNLRLPGQYDEKLLASIGIQGPYYNWNRWDLPMAGRYLELDPIALIGGFNGGYGPSWNAYAEGNPFAFSDPMGLQAPCLDSVTCDCSRTWNPEVCGPRPAPPPKCEPVPPKPPIPAPFIPPIPPDAGKKLRCVLIGSGGKGPRPGAMQRCTYLCEAAGRSYQIDRYFETCPDTFDL